MAYGVKYRFRTENYCIEILKNGYTGTVLARNLGAAPVLRMDDGGAIRGTSLAFTAECQVESEFIELYTSVATEFKVVLYHSHTGVDVPIWTGFVSPEIYSEPDIAPPYDVSITATDGLGELKNYAFGNDEATSLYDQLTNILDQTGLSRQIRFLGELKTTNYEPDETLTECMTNLSNEVTSEKTCYEVLEDILNSLRAYITVVNDEWLIVRETDVVKHTYTSNGRPFVRYYDCEGTPGDQSVQMLPEFGLMYKTPTGCSAPLTHYPVGYLSTEVVPAKKGVTLVADLDVPESCFPSFDATGGWTFSGAAWNSAYCGFWEFTQGDYCEASMEFGSVDDLDLIVEIIAAVAHSSAASPLKVEVRFEEEVSGDVYYWDGTSAWQTTQCNFDVTIDAARLVRNGDNTSEDAFDKATALVELTDISGMSGTMYFKVTNVVSTSHDVIAVNVRADKWISGVEQVVSMQNNAREDGGSESFVFGSTQNKTISDEFANAFLCGQLAYDGGSTSYSWKTLKLTTADNYLHLMGRDYALSWFYPRLRKNGTLAAIAPFTRTQGWPFAFWSDREQAVYLCDSYEWNLLEDEVTVVMTQIPLTQASEV